VLRNAYIRGKVFFLIPVEKIDNDLLTHSSHLQGVLACLVNGLKTVKRDRIKNRRKLTVSVDKTVLQPVEDVSHARGKIPVFEGSSVA